jgi:chemotaxis response regulator CheB
VVVQHIAKGFLDGFADWLNSECAISVRVARPGETLEPGSVYIAPDDVHLGVTSSPHLMKITPKHELDKVHYYTHYNLLLLNRIHM